MTPDDDPRARRRPWIAAVALAGIAAACNAWMSRGQVFSPIDDETLLVPIALRHAGLATYAGDRWLATTAPIFSVPYSWLLGALLRFVDDPVVALRWLALAFHVVFLAGTWKVVERFAGRAAAAVTVVACVLPPLNGLVLAPGGGLPRDLVFALLPWFVLGADAARTRRGAALAVFAALGVAANLHPLTALHAVAWLLLLEVVRDPSARGVGAAALRGLAFAAGAAPFVVQYLSRPAVAGAVDETVFAWRLGSMGGETIGPWTLRMETLLWLAAAAVVLCIASRRAGAAMPKWLVAGALTALALAALGPTIGRFVAPLRAFQLARFERIATWSALMLVAGAGAAAGAGAWRGRRFAAIGVAAAFVAVAAWGPSVLGGVPPRGPIARLGRRIDRDAGAPYAPPAPAGLVARAGASDPTSPADRGPFLAVCEFARGSTPVDALFLVPPEHWGPFRVHARRGAVVTRKEGGAALSFLGAAGMEWFRDYADAVRVYAEGDPAAWEGLARRSGASFAVIDAATASPPPWPVAFEAAPFRVLAVPAK